jgi:hypothetical protein
MNGRSRINPLKDMDHYHLTPSAGIWTLTREGNRKVIGEFESKSAALAGSARMMLGRESSLKIHKEDGSITEERTFPGQPVRRAEKPVEPWEEEAMPGLAPYTFK